MFGTMAYSSSNTQKKQEMNSPSHSYEVLLTMLHECFMHSKSYDEWLKNSPWYQIIRPSHKLPQNLIPVNIWYAKPDNCYKHMVYWVTVISRETKVTMLMEIRKIPSFHFM
jgi:hypothetical protein